MVAGLRYVHEGGGDVLFTDTRVEFVDIDDLIFEHTYACSQIPTWNMEDVHGKGLILGAGELFYALIERNS